jgi:hypothetical protein
MKELASTVNHALDALKSSPFLMALMMFQFMLLGIVAWNAHDVRSGDSKRFELLLKQCSPREQTSSGFDRPRLQSDESKPFVLPPLPELSKEPPETPSN